MICEISRAGRKNFVILCYDERHKVHMFFHFKEYKGEKV